MRASCLRFASTVAMGLRRLGLVARASTPLVLASAFALALVLFSPSPASAQVTTSAQLNGAGSFALPSIPAMGTAATVETWVYVQSHGAWTKIMDVGNGPHNNNILIMVGDGTSAKPSFWIDSNGATIGHAIAPNPIPLRTWVHLAGVIESGGRMRLYVNGIEVVNVQASGTLANVARNSSFIGKSNWSEPNFNGSVADVRIWNAARTQAQIQAGMTLASISGATTGLVAAYPFGATGQPVLNDVSGNNRTLTPSGSIAYQTAGPASPLPGPADDVIVADLVGSAHLTIPTLPAMGVPITMEAWVFPRSVVEWGRIIEIAADGGNGASSMVLYTSGDFPGRPNFTIWSRHVSWPLYLNAPNPLPLHTWSHVAAVVDSDRSARLYVNGQVVASGTSSELPPSVGRTFNLIGRSDSGNGNTAFGDVRVWNTARTQAQIQATMAVGSVTGPATGLVAAYPFGQTGQPSLNDVSGNNRTLIPSGSVRFTSTGPTPPRTSSAWSDGASGSFMSMGSTVPVTGAFTVEGWVRPTSYSESARLVDYGGSSDNILLVSSQTTSGRPQFIVNRAGSAVLGLTAPDALPLNMWSHVAGVINADRSSALYVNGRLVASGTATQLPNVTGTLSGLIGGNRSGGTSVNGGMADVRIWSVGRTQAEIQSAMPVGSISGAVTGLVAAYPFGATGQWVFNDVSGNNRTLTGSGNVQFQILGPSSPPAAAADAMVTADLKGSGYYTMGALPAGRDFTVEAWVNPRGYQVFGRIVDLSNAGYPNDNLLLMFANHESTKPVFWVFYGTDNTFFQVTAPDPIPLNAWSHIAGTIDSSGVMRVFVNGRQVASGTAPRPANLVARSNNRIGASHDPTIFNGSIADVRIWSYARTEAQIQSTLPVGSISGPAVGLMRAYPLGSTGADVLSDITLSGSNLTQLGSPEYRKTGPGFLSAQGFEGSASLVTSAGQLTLPGNNTYTGTTTIGGGAVQVGTGGTTGSLGTGNVSNSGILTFDRSDNFTVANAISGPGSLFKQGAGALTLSGPNSFTGGLTVRSGSVALTGDIANNAGNAITVNSGATFSINRHDTLGGHATTPLTPFVVQSGAVLQAGDGRFNVMGPITLQGGTLRTTSGLASANGWSFALRGTVTVDGGATTSVLEGPGMALGATSVSSATFDVADGSAADDLVVSGGLINGPASAWPNMQASGLVKTGAGRMTLTGTNAYTGTTTISAGTLQVGNGGTNGTLGSGNVVNNATLAFNRGDDFTLGNAISGSGSVVKQGAGLLSLTGTSSISGTTTVSAGTLQVGNGGTSGALGSGNVVNNAALVFNRSDAFTVGNTISGSGSVTKTGAGTMTLATVNSHAGGTFVNGGTLHLSAGETGTGRIRVDVTVASGARLLMSVHNTLGWDPGLKVNTITINGGLVENSAAGGQGYGILYRMTGGELRSNGGVATPGAASHYAMGGAGAGISTLPSTSVATISGVLRLREDNPNNMLPIDVADGAASPDLVISAAIDQQSFSYGIHKTGPGTLLLSGDSSFTRGLRVSGGTVSITGTLANNATNVATVESGAVLSLDRNLFGRHDSVVALPFVVQAGGTLRNGINSATGGGFLNILGPVTLNGGTLLSSGSHLVDGTFAYSFLLRGTVTVNGGGTTSVIDGPGFTLGSASVTSTTFDVADGSAAVDLLVSGSLGNGPDPTWPTPQASSLVKTGAGTMLLSGNNTYTGTTTVSGGTLQVGNGGTNGTLGSGNVVNNATLAFNRSDNLTVGNAVSGTGALVKQGAGTLTVTGNGSYSGTTTVSGGTLQVGNGGTSGALGSGNVVNNAALVFNRSDAFTVGNTISGSGSVTKTGAGTMTLATVNSHAGGTFVNGGTLHLSAGETGTGRIRGDVTVASGARLLMSVHNTLGWDPGLKVNTITINGGLVENSAAGGQGWGIAYRMTGGELRSAGTAVSGDASHFSMGGGTTITTLASANTATISGLIRLREQNPSNVLTIDVANGTAATDLLISAAIDQSNVTGGITKTGEGTLALSGTSGFTGPTTVSAGTLALTGSGSIASSSAITVAAGATFDVSGRSSTMALGASQTLANSGGTASLRGNLTATSGIVAMALANASTPAFSVAGGTCTLGSNTTLRVTVSGTALAAGTYKLVSKDSGGSVSGPSRLAVTIQGSGLASGQGAYAQVASGELFLRVVPTATITLDSLAQSYNGTARAASATTVPSGLAVSFTYDGSSTAPVAVGSYSVVASIADTNYVGTASGTLVISKGQATISLGNLVQSYDGTARRVVASTVPSGLSWSATYNGSANAPTNLGTYTVVATVTDPNYLGFTNGVLSVKAGNPSLRPAATPQPPAYLNHHGFLTDVSGNPLGSPNPRNHDVIFRIFATASGGASLWSERQVVTVDEGEYDVMLGEGMSHGIEPWPALDSVLSSGTGTSRYLEVTVRGIGIGGSDVTLLPRFLLPSQPYSFLARHARTAEVLVDSNSVPLLRVSGTAVGIGVEQANATLDVGGVLTATAFASEGNATIDGRYTATEFQGGGTLPVGSIIVWTGGAAPDGWALCDGQTVNGRRTPDLRGRFVLGQGQGPGLSARSTGQIEGAESYTLAVSHMAAHLHVFDPPETSAGRGGGHAHSYQTHSVHNQLSIGYSRGARNSDDTRHVAADRWVSHGSHQHSLSFTLQSTGAGGGRPHSTMPPFYVLTYIMRVR